MIEKDDMEYLSEIFMPRAECRKSIEVRDREIFKVQQDIAVLVTKINMLIGILGAIAVPVLAIAIKLLFGE